MEAHVRVLTGADRGAVAVVRVWGPDAGTVADAVFRPHRGGPLHASPAGRLRVGTAGVGRGDEVVAVRLDGAEPVVEFQCHGGVAAVASVVRALEGAGAVRLDGDDEPARATGDRLAAQAMTDLAQAPTLRSAEILLDQARGALDREIEILRQANEDTASRLDALRARGALGLRLLTGWKVVIAGRPNVGKSRLFNALAGFDRSIVDPTPGVTRDVVAFRTALDGWPVELCDTAGQRETDDPVEGLGIERARRESGSADLLLVVVDRSQPLTPLDRGLLASTTGSPRLIVASKADLATAWPLEEAAPTGEDVLAVSAETGEGLDRLMAAIAARLIPRPPEPGAGVPFRGEHMQLLARAAERLAANDIAGFQDALDDLGGKARSR